MHNVDLTGNGCNTEVYTILRVQGIRGVLGERGMKCASPQSNKVVSTRRLASNCPFPWVLFTEFTGNWRRQAWIKLYFKYVQHLPLLDLWKRKV